MAYVYKFLYWRFFNSKGSVKMKLMLENGYEFNMPQEKNIIFFMGPIKLVKLKFLMD